MGNVKSEPIRFILSNPSKYKIVYIPNLKKITKDFIRESYANIVFIDPRKPILQYYRTFLKDTVYCTYNKCDSKDSKIIDASLS